MRQAKVERSTSETQICVTLNLDGEGNSDIKTPVAFLNHMLELFAKHSKLDLNIKAQGDVQVDFHHTVEDIGICLGKALCKALGDKKGIRRYGSSFVPMDESLVLCVIDLSGRPYLVFDVELSTEKVGEFDTELVQEFFRGLTSHGMFNLHLKLFWGSNTHHIIEALFKALGRSVRQAVEFDLKEKGIPSTKGKL